MGQAQFFPSARRPGPQQGEGGRGLTFASERDSRMVVTGSTKGEAGRSRKQNRDGVEVFGYSGSWAVRSVASRRSPPRSSSGDGGPARRREASSQNVSHPFGTRPTDRNSKAGLMAHL
jgi:hypothetical protein